MTDQPGMVLNDGRTMPQLGFGTWQIGDGEAAGVVRQAIEAGYRALDTAAAYGNEAGVGAAVARTSTPEQLIFITTKLANSHHGFDRTLAAAATSLEALKLEAADLYLIHWPMPKQGRYVETWRGLIELRKRGQMRSIGVSNFTVEHLERIIGETGVVPAVNQVELHPSFQQRTLRDFHARHGIVTQSWSPLGRGKLLDHPVLASIARKYGKSTAQVVIRWHIDSGLNVIPKSATPARIVSNAAVFDFALDTRDMAAIAGLDEPEGRVGPDPMTFG